MAEMIRAPMAICDNCGAMAEKHKAGNEWRKPKEWGHVRVAPTYWGTYPNNIDLMDLCQECNKVVHVAVVAALATRKGKPSNG